MYPKIQQVTNYSLQYILMKLPSTHKLVSYILDMNVEKKELSILSTLRNLATKYTNSEMEKAADILLEISTNPTVSVLKSVLERNKKRTQKQKNGSENKHTNTDDYGFVRGASYFGRDGK